MAALGFGLWFVTQKRRWVRYALVPAFIGLIVYILLFSIAFATLVPWLTAWASQQFGNNQVMQWLSIAVFLIAWFAASGMLMTTLFTSVGGFLWDQLSREVEQELTGRSVDGGLPLLAILADTIRRLFFAAGMALLAFVFGGFMPPLPAIVLGGTVALFDTTSGPYLRRGILFSAQRPKALKLPDALPYVLVAGVVSMIPIVNMFALPILIASGTALFVKGEQQQVAARA